MHIFLGVLVWLEDPPPAHHRACPAEQSPPSCLDGTQGAGISFMHLLLHHCCQSSLGFRRR